MGWDKESQVLFGRVMVDGREERVKQFLKGRGISRRRSFLRSKKQFERSEP